MVPPIRPRLKSSCLIVVSVILLAFQGGTFSPSAAASQSAEFPPVEEIEKELLSLANKEREAGGLVSLRASGELLALARNQSRDMSVRDLLTHESADGQSLSDRLSRAKVFFRASGENVARSESSVAEIIHESFMKSPEHRDNILHPDYEEAGIGVVRTPDNIYFITQDFIQSLVPLGETEVRDSLLRRLNEFRGGESLPPLVLVPEAGEIASSYALARAAGKKVKADPEILGKASLVFVSGPDLEGIAGSLRGYLSSSHSESGIGSWFGRTADYPGGAYYVCAIFLEGDPSEGLGAGGLAEIVLEAANDIRASRKREPLILDAALSKAAEGFSGRTRPGRAPQGTWVAIYETADLRSLPDSVRSRIGDRSYVGIGLFVSRNVEKGLRKSYTVAIVLEARDRPSF